MVIISNFLRKVARGIIAAGVKPQLLPEFFKALERFITDEPMENFTQMGVHQLKDLTPLNMNDIAEKNLKAYLSKVDPTLAGAVDTAKHGETFVNFLHIVGQIFTVTVMILESLSLKIADSDMKNRFQKACKSLYGIWGGEQSMNARSLFNRFSGLSNEAARRDLITRFKKSAHAVEQEILPLLDVVKEHQ